MEILDDGKATGAGNAKKEIGVVPTDAHLVIFAKWGHFYSARVWNRHVHEGICDCISQLHFYDTSGTQNIRAQSKSTSFRNSSAAKPDDNFKKKGVKLIIRKTNKNRQR